MRCTVAVTVRVGCAWKKFREFLRSKVPNLKMRDQVLMVDDICDGERVSLCQ